MSTGKYKCAVILIAAVLLAACDGAEGIIMDMPPATPSDVPPYVITRPVFEISARSGYFTYAGIVFNFLNTSDGNVDSITVSFMLFDEGTQASPFIGNNKFEITKMDLVLPDQNREIIISLDRFIYVAPTEPYLIDFFYVSEIHYTDDSIWQDKYGKYRVR